jgi:hypothetical protein
MVVLYVLGNFLSLTRLRVVGVEDNVGKGESAERIVLRPVRTLGPRFPHPHNEGHADGVTS